MDRKRSRGNSLVESTLVFMVLLTLMFSIFDFGYVLFEHQTLLHQARTAARYGAINPADTTGIQNVALYGQPVAPEGRPSGVFGLERAMVDISRPDVSTPEDRIVITVSGYHYTVVTPFMAGRFTGRPIEVSSPVETH